MRKKIAGLVLSATMLMGAAPFVGTAHANTTPPTTDTTDPVLCFVAAQSIITEALSQYRAGHLTARDLRSILVGTSTFLGDCLTPTA
jgi:hypothetical protein